MKNLVAMNIGLKIIEKLLEENPETVLEKFDQVLEETASKMEEILKEHEEDS